MHQDENAAPLASVIIPSTTGLGPWIGPSRACCGNPSPAGSFWPWTTVRPMIATSPSGLGPARMVASTPCGRPRFVARARPAIMHSITPPGRWSFTSAATTNSTPTIWRRPGPALRQARALVGADSRASSLQEAAENPIVTDRPGELFETHVRDRPVVLHRLDRRRDGAGLTPTSPPRTSRPGATSRAGSSSVFGIGFRGSPLHARAIASAEDKRGAIPDETAVTDVLLPRARSGPVAGRGRRRDAEPGGLSPPVPRGDRGPDGEEDDTRAEEGPPPLGAEAHCEQAQAEDHDGDTGILAQVWRQSTGLRRLALLKARTPVSRRDADPAATSTRIPRV